MARARKRPAKLAAEPGTTVGERAAAGEFSDRDLNQLGGRPRSLDTSEATLKIVRGLARIQCTKGEAASVFGVNETTFGRYLAREPSAAEAWEAGRELGKMTLRRYQFDLARTNVAMAIWLGKNYLDQKDERFWKGSLATLDLTKLTDGELDTLGRLLEAAGVGELADLTGASARGAPPTINGSAAPSGADGHRGE